jgi:protein SCO1/2
MRQRHVNFWASALAAAVFLARICGAAETDTRADRTEPLPGELEGVGVTEHLNAPLPLDAAFKDETGKPVRFGACFQSGKPVILVMFYSDCPMLCNLVLNGLVESLQGLKWTAGQEFRIATVSLDPAELPARAKLTQQRYVSDYGRPGAAAGWNFLTGKEADIKAVASAAGFNYRYIEDRKMYAHSAVIMVCTPDGRLSRYLYGVKYDPETLRMSLVEASAGKIGTAMDQILLFCFAYDSHKGRYSFAMIRIMQLGGVLTIIVMGLFLGRLWLRERTPRPDQTVGGSPCS